MIDISVSPWQTMVAHAQSTYPNECCGVMLGKIDGDSKSVTIATPLENVSAGSQAARYELRPEDLLNADREARRAHRRLHKAAHRDQAALHCVSH